MKAFTIGGPKLWLAYAAALGTGMCSFTFAGWVRTGLGWFSLADSGLEGILLMRAFVLVGFGAFLFAAWRFTRRRFEHDPDLPECRRLLFLVYGAMVSTILSVAMAPAMMHVLVGAAFGEPPGEIPTSSGLAMLAWAVVAALLPVRFAERNPRHGFFCAGLISVVSYSTLFEFVFESAEEQSSALYVIPVRMALVFIYLSTGIRMQRIIAGLCVVVSICSPGVLGAVYGTISWSSRREKAKQRQAPTPEKESMEGSIRGEGTGVTEENRTEPSTDGTGETDRRQ